MKGPCSLTTIMTQCKDRKIFWGQTEFNVEVNLKASTSEKSGASQNQCNIYLTSSWAFSTGQKPCQGLACVRLPHRIGSCQNKTDRIGSAGWRATSGPWDRWWDKANILSKTPVLYLEFTLWHFKFVFSCYLTLTESWVFQIRGNLIKWKHC